jgi:lysophospholipase L1-like esterase
VPGARALNPVGLLRRALANVALVAFGLAVALGLCELVARLTWRPPPRPSSGIARPPEDLPVLRTLMQLAPRNVRGVLPNGAYYRTNSLGVRGPEYDRPAPPGVFRIVTVGDSVTMGAGVEEQDTYSAQLAATLAARHPGHRFEVINAGLAGLDIVQIVGRLENVGLPYDPNLVVYGWTMNDITGPTYHEFARPRATYALYHAVYDRFAGSRSYLLRMLWPRWISFRELVAPDPASYTAELRYNYFDNREAWDRFAAQLDRLAEIGRERGICVVVFIHTSLVRLNAFHPLRSIYERVGEAAEARGLHAIQSLSALVGRNEASLRVSYYDWHPNRAGHALLAQALADGIDALPAECGVTSR